MTPPPLAVTVILKVPVVAVLLAVNVSLELPFPGAAMDVGLKLAVNPAGKPETDKLSAALNPPVAAVVIVVAAEFPCAIDRLEGEALTVKSGLAAALIVTATVVLCVTPPPEAFTVALKVPAAAAVVVENVSVELPLPGAAREAGLKLAVTPDGSPVTESETAELKPPVTALDTVVLTEPPWVTDKEEGEALRVKSGVCVPGLKMISRTGCSSIPLGATPVWPCRKSNIPTPTICTGMFAV